jgi:hypothetical protein
MADLKECAFCAVRLPESELGEFEVSWRYKGVKEPTNGFYICLRCKKWMQGLIQQKTMHTWMVIRARKEKPCCGGGG